MRRRISLCAVCLLIMGMISCGTIPATRAEAPKAPTVKLDAVELAHYWGYWFISKKVEPTKGKLDANVGAPLDLAFIFTITNPNPFPVQLDGFKFTISFEEFELNTVNTYETMWIPADKTSQYRVHAMFDVATSFLSLGVTGGFKLQEKNISPWDQLEKWWTEIPTFSFPIKVSNGTASFRADDQSVISAFEAVYPPSGS